MMVKITQLPPETWQEYRKIRLAALQSDPAAYGITYDEELQTTEAQWRESIKNVWFALADDQVVGMIGLLRETTFPGKHRGHIVSFWVQPTLRGQGVGKKLVMFLQDYARLNNMRKLYLHVTSTQEGAIKLYESLGFVKVGLLKENTRCGNKYLDQYLMEWLVADPASKKIPSQ